MCQMASFLLIIAFYDNKNTARFLNSILLPQFKMASKKSEPSVDVLLAGWVSLQDLCSKESNDHAFDPLRPSNIQRIIAPQRINNTCRPVTGKGWKPKEE